MLFGLSVSLPRHVTQKLLLRLSSVFYAISIMPLARNAGATDVS